MRHINVSKISENTNLKNVENEQIGDLLHKRLFSWLISLLLRLSLSAVEALS